METYRNVKYFKIKIAWELNFISHLTNYLFLKTSRNCLIMFILSLLVFLKNSFLSFLVHILQELKDTTWFCFSFPTCLFFFFRFSITSF